MTELLYMAFVFFKSNTVYFVLYVFLILCLKLKSVKMWVLLSLMLGILFVYTLFWLGIRWDFTLIVGVVYYMYLPRRNKWIRDARLWTWFRTKHLSLSYKGNTKVLKDKKQAYCFGVHPHGAHCVGAVAIASDKRLEHIRMACTSVLFWLPILKEFVSWGNAIPVIKELMIERLLVGDSIAVYPGAFNELPGAVFMREKSKLEPNKPENKGWDGGEDEPYYTYNKRKGFIKVAKKAGVPLVPVWVDGEYDLYKVYHTCPWLQKKIYDWTRYPGPFYSRGWYGSWWPKAGHLTVYVGTPIETTGSETVDELHRLFYLQLEDLKATCKKTKQKKIMN